MRIATFVFFAFAGLLLASGLLGWLIRSRFDAMDQDRS